MPWAKVDIHFHLVFSYTSYALEIPQIERCSKHNIGRHNGMARECVFILGNRHSCLIIILYVLIEKSINLYQKHHDSHYSHIYISTSSFPPPSQLTATPLLAPHTPVSIDLRHRSALLVRIRQQRALVELLRAGRHVDGWVAREEVDWLEVDFEDFAGHDGEVFDAWNLLVACVR
jgi:hypothetical protein